MLFANFVNVFLHRVPRLLTHNYGDVLRPFDFPAPVFQFLIGVSLALFLEKHARLGRTARGAKVAALRRFALLVLLGMLLDCVGALHVGLRWGVLQTLGLGGGALAAAFYGVGIPFNKVLGTSSFVALAAALSAATLAVTALVEHRGVRFPDWLRAVGGNALTAWVLQYVLVYYPAWIAFPSWRRLPLVLGMVAILATTTALSAFTVALGRRGIRIPI